VRFTYLKEMSLGYIHTRAYVHCVSKSDHQLMAITLSKPTDFQNSFTIRKKSKL